MLNLDFTNQVVFFLSPVTSNCSKGQAFFSKILFHFNDYNNYVFYYLIFEYNFGPKKIIKINQNQNKNPIAEFMTSH